MGFLAVGDIKLGAPSYMIKRLTFISPLVSGVVTAVVFITLCVVAVMAHFLYQHRQVRRTASIQEKEHRHSLEAAYRAELHLNNSMRDNMKEYYI